MGIGCLGTHTETTWASRNDSETFKLSDTAFLAL